jgi:hypothetical protein
MLAGSLTSVPWDLTVDVPGTATVRTFRSRRPGCGLLDARTLGAPAEESAPARSTGVDPSSLARSSGALLDVGPGGCLPSPTALCLQGDRFRVEASWRNPRDGTHGVARALPLRDRSGFFSFFDRGNPEVAVKVVDGRALNGAFWFFDGRLTDLEYELVVTDTRTGERHVYVRPAGSLCGGADIHAFTEVPAP